MSVINQMLRDLDARAATDQERAGLPPRLRTLPAGTRVRRQNLRLLALGMGAGVLLTILLLVLFRLLTASEPVSVSPPVAPPVAPPAVQAPVVHAPVVQTPVVQTPAAAPAAPVIPVDAGEMKLSTLINPAKPAPAPIAPPPMPAAKPAPAVKPATIPAPQSAPLPPAGETQIDKRNKGDQGHEMADAEYRKAMQAVKRGDNEAAIPLFKRALEFDPGLARARQGYLSVLVAAKRWAEARKVADDGLNLDPTQTGWANIVARLQFEQGDTSGAIQTLERFAVHASHDADYQGLFAYLLQKQQRPAEAAERFKAALQVRPNEGRWWFGLALSLEQAGNVAEAKEAYAKAKAAGNLPADMAATVEQKLK